jgi:hypothetical protein
VTRRDVHNKSLLGGGLSLSSVIEPVNLGCFSPGAWASRLMASRFKFHNDSSAFCCDFAPPPADFNKTRVEQWS